MEFQSCGYIDFCVCVVYLVDVLEYWDFVGSEMLYLDGKIEDYEGDKVGDYVRLV